MSPSSTASGRGPHAVHAAARASERAARQVPEHGADTGAEATTPSSTVPGAGGVVFDADGRVLVLHHVDGAWVFPKGHIEAGETSAAAAVREVAEEAGVDAEVIADAPTWTTDYRNDRDVSRRITWYACTTAATDVTLTERTFTGGGFYPPDIALQRLTHDSDRELLASVLTALGIRDEGAR